MSVRPFARAVMVAAVSIGLLGLGVGGSPAPGSHAVRSALYALLTPSPAFGQEIMEFKPVPAESLTLLERRPRRAERSAPSAPPAVSAPGALPAEPTVPDVPEPPELSRSGHMMRIGSDVHVEKGQVVDGDVFSLRGDVRVDGHVKGNVAATGGDVFLGATARVDGDVVCIGGQLHEESGASVGGQRVTALRGGEGRIGRRGRRHIPDIDLGDLDHGERAGDFVGSIVWLLFWLGAAWMVTKFAPVRTATALDTLRREPGMSLLVGFIAALLVAPSLVALALVMVILCITIIGIPLAIGAILGYIGLLILVTGWGFLVAVIPVGRHVGSRLGTGNRALGAAGAPQGLTLMRAAIYGVLAIDGLCVIANFLDFLPFFGWVSKLIGVVFFVASSVLVMMGAGALIRSKFGQGPGGQWWPIRRTAPSATPAAPAASAPAAPAPPASAAPAASDQNWTGGPPAGGLEPSPPTA